MVTPLFCGSSPKNAMMKTIAVIASCDTKYKEAALIRSLIEQTGNRCLTVDIAIGLGESIGADISREEVFRQNGKDWETIKNHSKGELMALMTSAAAVSVKKLYEQGEIDGVLAVGGLQNTTVATTAMQCLPIGFPKVMATTIASGGRQFGSVVGDKDIVVIPSIADFTGENPVTRLIIQNAVACIAGMVQYGGRSLSKGNRPVVGVTLMGVTNTGCCGAIEELERLGVDAIGFHTTGVGGRIMEQMAEDGLLDGILDLCLHEVTSEYFGGGFSYGALGRITKPVALGIPYVAAPGGLDFVDFAVNDFCPRMEERVFLNHNATMRHIKILPDEAAKIGAIVGERLSGAKQPVTFILPTNGMRKNTRPGEELYMQETDEQLIAAIRANLSEQIEVQEIAGNLDEKAWGIAAAHVMIERLRQAGIVSEGCSDA